MEWIICLKYWVVRKVRIVRIENLIQDKSDRVRTIAIAGVYARHNR